MRASIRFLSLLLLFAPALSAQHLKTPEVSPHARAEETVGITDITVDYHRPAVNNRRIFGGLVPYDVIWRAGANQPTLVTFSTPVKVEGQPLAAGTYSFYLVPAEKQWTAVFNKFTGGWGTYSYDESEDALRVKIEPQTAEMQERLLYTFDDAKPDAVTLSLRWDKTRVPLRITMDTRALTAASIRNQLRSELHWDPQAWTEAARYTAMSGDLDGALAYVDHAIGMLPDAQSLRFKARLLDRKGDAQGSKQAMELAGKLASPEMAAQSGVYMLMAQKKYDDAAKAVEKMVAADPKSWRAHVAMGDLFAAQGNAAKAKESYAKAMALAPTQSERVEVQDSINALMAKM